MTAILTTVVPLAKADTPQFRGWSKERCNRYTQTLSLRFVSVEDAVFIGQKIPYPWAIESAYR